MSRTLLGWFCAAFAAVVLALAWGEAFSPLAHSSFGISAGLLEPDASGKNAIITRVLPRSPAAAASLRAGDLIDLSALSLSDRYRLIAGVSPVGTAIDLTVQHDRTTRTVTLRPEFIAQAVGYDVSYAMVAQATIQIVILALLVLLRPSLATAALVFYSAGSVTTFGVVGEFSWLPDPWFGLVAVVIVAAFSALPYFALPVFLTRFPHPPKASPARLRMHVADALFFVAAVAYTLEAIFEPMPFQTWGAIDIWSQVAALVIVLAFAVTAYRNAGGEERRRIGWVMAGFVVTALTFAGENVILSGNLFTLFMTSNAMRVVWNALQLATCALPIALAYAVLRHRVLDIGFAVNRTVVYATMTTLVVGVVSLLDWGVSRLFAEQRWALAVEGFVTVGFGFTLNWLHARTERLIDRIVFRKRHVAERRIEYRVDALGYAESSASVDEALAVDACSILELRSGAVFSKAASPGTFMRTLSTGWRAGTAESIETGSLLVRTLRSVERPLFLDDLAVRYAAFPEGELRPVLAIPIVAQHELIGFTLYGNRADGASPDPEEVALLVRVATAAGNAYGAVEARQWRARAAQLNVLPLPS